jgi:hypothetical protein
LTNFETSGDFYAHASAGCLHLRPLLNPKSTQFTTQLRGIASEAVDLVIRLGGSTSGEHGDGISRSEWLEKLYGKDIVAAFRDLKHAADPTNLLNPGKIIDPLPMDSNLRYQLDSQAIPWQPVLNFDSQSGLSGAVEMCNGAGVCRKDFGVMCPSFQVTQEEMHSTRGRANLLREYLSNTDHLDKRGSIASVHAALDLCLACTSPNVPRL